MVALVIHAEPAHCNVLAGLAFLIAAAALLTLMGWAALRRAEREGDR